ncbi:MAG: TetR/AcrR family transcriptional regulator [Rhodocyclaceae bacterium]|jgi:AcrR family transcriptional regulator
MSESQPEPVTRNRDRTRAQILAAARDEFAERGFDGARVDAIAERAGSNKRMLYYYFESKEALFLAVMEDTYRSIREAERELKLLEMAPIEAIKALMTFTWNYYIEHPEFLSILNTENLYRGTHLKRSSHLHSLNSKVIDTLQEILVRGRNEGVFRGGVDPLQLYISIAALSYFYLSNNFTLSAVFGRPLDTSRARVERLQHMIDMVLGYLVVG